MWNSNGTERKKSNNEYPIISQAEFEKSLKKTGGQEQVYSIALFEVLRFFNFVKYNGNQVILERKEILQKSDLLMYITEDGTTKIEVTFNDDTVWLSIDQMAELFSA